MTPPGAAAESLVERTVYGEAHPDAAARNLRGRPYLVLDGAGAATTPAYDFKGNPLAAERRLAADPVAELDWSALADLTDLAALLDPETFTTQLGYDALGRVTARTTPDGSETVPTYNEAGLLERIAVRLPGAAEPTAFVDDVDYNARGQRARIAYGNGTVTTYDHDPLTFRLTRLRTVRTRGGFVLQDLGYVLQVRRLDGGMGLRCHRA